MKIGFIAHYNPNDRRAWSGTYSSIIHELRKHHQVDLLFKKLNFFEKEYFLEQRNWYRWVRKKNLRPDGLRRFSKLASKKLDKLLLNKEYDLLIAPASNQRFAYSNTTTPIICIIDATIKNLYGYYKEYSNLPKFNYEQALEIDRLAYNKAAFIYCASDWAADSVIKDFDISPSKVIVQPFGANLIHEPSPESLTWTRTDTCRLLFLGVDWERKGGAIAVETLESLNARGFKASLMIIGCTPPEEVQKIPNVSFIPFLNKNKQDEEHQLIEIIHESDFLLLPTRAECAGIVFCEASAYGLPIVSTDTGGVSNYVCEGVNGFLLSKDKSGQAYADILVKVFSDQERYSKLRQTTRELFLEKLNWHVWADAFGKLAEKAVASRKD